MIKCYFWQLTIVLTCAGKFFWYMLFMYALLQTHVMYQGLLLQADATLHISMQH